MEEDKNKLFVSTVETLKQCIQSLNEQYEQDRNLTVPEFTSIMTARDELNKLLEKMYAASIAKDD